METIQHLQSRLVPFATDVFRLALWFLLIMVIFVPLERLFAVRRQRVFRRLFLLDVGYYILNNFLPKLILAVPMTGIAWGLRHLVPDGLHAWVAGMPLGSRLAAALVVGEFGFYWGHRWTHEIPLLWRFHAIHHSAEEIDWLVSSRGHPLDLVFVRLCGFVPMYALGLGQPTMGQNLDLVPLLIILIGTVWGFFIHANLRWRLGWFGLLVSTPAFHHWHHTNDEHVNKNYASMLPIMDKLFGTWYMPKKQWPPKYGIDTPVPSNLAGQLLDPLLPGGYARQLPDAIGATIPE